MLQAFTLHCEEQYAHAHTHTSVECDFVLIWVISSWSERRRLSERRENTPRFHTFPVCAGLGRCRVGKQMVCDCRGQSRDSLETSWSIIDHYRMRLASPRAAVPKSAAKASAHDTSSSFTPMHLNSDRKVTPPPQHKHTHVLPHGVPMPLWPWVQLLLPDCGRLRQVRLQPQPSHSIRS